MRQWRGHTHTVLVREDGFEYDGQRLSVADRDCPADYRGTLVGPAVLWCYKRASHLKSPRSANEKTRNHSAAERNCPLCDLHPQIFRGGARAGIQFAAGAARSVRSLHQQPTAPEGWVCLPSGYDDGGFSGATMDRPALQRLLADLTTGRVDTVVVYKIDRLTRSLADFAKIVEILDTRGASFVLGDAAVQYHHFDGAPHAQFVVVVCAVRARGHRRAHPRPSTARRRLCASSFAAMPNSAPPIKAPVQQNSHYLHGFAEQGTDPKATLIPF